MENFDLDDLHTKALCHHEQIVWMGALFRAIESDLNNDHADNAKNLVSLGRYLADDLGNFAELELSKVANSVRLSEGMQ